MGVRRAVLHDRRARPSAVLVWAEDEALASASVRLPDQTWISVEPRAGAEAPWGVVDRLWRGSEPLTVLTATDWAHVTTIPTVAEPGRIPAGGGTALLNLLATLARDQGVTRVTYDGPYPTEALFLSLTECFRPDPVDEPLARFMAGDDLGWSPAPFEPCFGDTAYVQWRARVEKVVWRGRVYAREDWGAVRRHAPLRVHDDGDGVRCSLWALGAPIEGHLLLDADGRIRSVVAPALEDAPVRPLRPAIRDGVIAIVTAMSAAALGDDIRAAASALRYTCGPLEADLARVDGEEARVSATLAAAIARKLRSSAAPEARAQLALAALAEIAAALGDVLRARAQARLAAASPAAQAAALTHPRGDSHAAEVIAAAVGDLVASARVDDEPDVERDERGDGND